MRSFPSIFAAKTKIVPLLVALVGTLVLNVLVFMLLPYLIQGDNGLVKPDTFETINLVRVTQPPPPQRQQAEQKPPEKTLNRQRISQTKVPMPTPQLHLNLELQPDLPNLAGQVVMPQVQLAQLDPILTIFDSAALDKPLTPLAQSPFIYPLRAKRLGIEGWVKIKLLVSQQGEVEQVQILEAQPPDVFEQTVERGVRSWRFTPGTVEGQAVRSWVITTVRFELES
ncbi:MAG: TonB family protein [Desulfuromonas sp.]|nr:TonB family protein [Desulfuromonas sp.]